MIDAKATHTLEQGLASFRTTGAMLAQLYLGGREQGLGRIDAATVACEYVVQLARAAEEKRKAEGK